MSEINDIFHDFAANFAGRNKDANPICFSEKLSRDQLDLSLASLKLVDAYLLYVHQHQHELNDDEWASTVLYGGAYVGEVMRSATDDAFQWIDYDDYIVTNPDLQKLIPERNVELCAALVTGEGGLCFPLQKIAKHIENGTEDSVVYFATCFIKDLEDAG